MVPSSSIRGSLAIWSWYPARSALFQFPRVHNLRATISLMEKDKCDRIELYPIHGGH